MSENALNFNLQQIQLRIKAACEKAGRAEQEVRLLSVTKTVEESVLRQAYELGLHQFGENKVQEAHEKWQALSDLPNINWTIIGHLQRNKAKQVAQFANEFHALDSLRLAQELDQRLQILGREMDVLVQVNTSGEESKSGFEPESVLDFMKQLPAFSSLRVKGLMTLACNSSVEQEVRACFICLRQLRERLQQEAPQGQQIQELSMGMSGDFEWAIEEGSTLVRIGQAIFGKRQAPQSQSTV